MNRNYRIALEIYLSESLKEKDLSFIHYQLEEQTDKSKYYLIFYDEKSQDMLTILKSKDLNKTIFTLTNPLLVGIAADESESNQLVEQMVKDCIVKNGNCDLREYFRNWGPSY